MTGVEEREYLRRKGEDDLVKDLDSKIEAMMAKVEKARSDRNNEVMWINKRRETYDEKVKTREDKRSAGSSIRERERREAQEKEEILKMLRNRGRIQDKREKKSKND